MDFREMVEFTKKYPLNKEYIIHLEENNILVKQLISYKEQDEVVYLNFKMWQVGNEITVLENISPLLVTINE
jgi:hypothetical protein